MNNGLKWAHLLVMLLTVSLVVACQPGHTHDDDEVVTPNNQADAEETPQRELLRSPSARGEEPAHRQIRREPTRDERPPRPDGGSEPCEAEALITSDGPALVFRHLSSLQTHLPFSGALSALSVSNGGTGSPAEQEAIMQSMFDTFAETAFVNSGSGTTVTIMNRLQEAGMDPGAFISQMMPVATFNRLDLAANDGSVCGEQRVTFALAQNVNTQIGTPIGGQFTVIFEARYPNPLQDPVNIMNGNGPSNSIEDCLPVAEFWESLVTMNDDNDRATAVAEFFLTGHTLANGVFLPPVVAFSNYQSPMGQIRTNQFVQSPWQLREFRTDITSGSVELVVDTVKGNPVSALYDSASTFAQNNPALRTSFLTELTNQMDNLLAPEINGLTAVEEILTSFEPSFPDSFSGFTSVSQGNGDNPSTQASSDVRTLIAAEIAARLGNSIPANSTVNEDQVLNRLGSMTCGGCHQYSSNSGGVDITDTVTWPLVGAPGAFIQVRAGNGPEADLSAALTGTFLPLRRQFLLDTWLCDEVTTPGCVDDDDCEDGFSCVAGECVEDNVSTGCQTDYDCPDGYVCDAYGDCVLPVTTTTACEEPFAEITGPQGIHGSNTDSRSEFEGSCGGDGAEDVVVFTPEEGGTYCIDTKGTRGDAFLYARHPDCRSSRSEIGCSASQDHPTNQNVAFLELNLEAGQPYFLFIDSSSPSNVWQLNIIRGECPTIGEPNPDPDPVNACDEPSREATQPGSFMGNSDGGSAEFSGSCGGSGAEEVIAFTPDASGAYCFNTSGSVFPNVIYVRASVCDAADAELGCAQTGRVDPEREVIVTGAQIDFDLLAGETYYAFVDGLIGTGGGNWVLTIESGPCRRSGDVRQ